MLLNPNALDKVVRAPFKVAEPIVKYELIGVKEYSVCRATTHAERSCDGGPLQASHSRSENPGWKHKYSPKTPCQPI
jgi:hypothetical protein